MSDMSTSRKDPVHTIYSNPLNLSHVAEPFHHEQISLSFLTWFIQCQYIVLTISINIIIMMVKGNKTHLTYTHVMRTHVMRTTVHADNSTANIQNSSNMQFAKICLIVLVIKKWRSIIVEDEWGCEGVRRVMSDGVKVHNSVQFMLPTLLPMCLWDTELSHTRRHLCRVSS